MGAVALGAAKAGGPILRRAAADGLVVSPVDDQPMLAVFSGRVSSP